MPIRAIATPAAGLVAICAKCGRKLGGGFGDGGEETLARALRTALGLPKAKRSRVRLVETRCLKLCPKGAVAVISSHDPGTIWVVPAGTPVAEVVDRLGLGPAAPVG